MKQIFSIIILSFLVSCNFPENNSNITNNNKSEYAKGFEIQQYTNLKKVTVFNKHENTEYYLIPEKQEINDSLKDKIVIKTPVKRVVCLSSTYLGYIELLDERESVCGLSSAKFIYDSVLYDNFQKDKIKEIGSYPNINVETIIGLKPDVVFVYFLGGSSIVQYEQLQQLGVQVVFVNEFVEISPLGRAEWLKFFAAFYDKEEFADKEFSIIEKKYNDLKNSALIVKNKPRVLVNIPFQGIWYLPGGDSYMANLIADAGGNYLWKNKKQNKSFTVTLEEILFKKDSIDILLNPGTVNSIDEILKSEKRISDFKFILNKNIFNNNKRLNKNGGNDFWESGVVKPDLILNDLIFIFNKQANDTNLYYYKKLY